MRHQKKYNPMHFQTTCFYQTEILGKQAKQNSWILYEQGNKSYEAETRSTNFEQTPNEQKKKLILYKNFF